MVRLMHRLLITQPPFALEIAFSLLTYSSAANSSPTSLLSSISFVIIGLILIDDILDLLVGYLSGKKN